MNRLLVAGLMVGMVVAAPSLLAAGGNTEAGKAVYDKKCALCHGQEGEGKESIAKMMKVELPHLGSKEVQAKSDKDLTKIITEGKGKMKPVAGLSDADKSNAVAFVRSLAKQ